MSELSQDTAQRIVDSLGRPLPEWIELAARYESDKSLEVERRYKPWPGMQEDENPWMRVRRHGHDFRLGGGYETTPNWQNDMYEWRAADLSPLSDPKP
jgi:hypothetical protein